MRPAREHMQETCITALLLVFMFASPGFPDAEAEPSKKCDLRVVLQGIKSEKGKINIALTSGPSQYYEDKEIFRTVRVAPAKGATEYIFTNIPCGRYAVKAYHDENNNNKLDTGLFGRPREKYGFSNNPVIKMRMPSFEETVFDTKGTDGVIEIRMR